MPDTPAYTLKKSRRSRTIRLSVYPDGRLVVSAPLFASLRTIERFLEARSAWIARTLAYFRSLPERPVIKSRRGDYARYKDAARALAEERLQYWNRRYGFVYGSVSVRDQKTRWGSCSRSGNLNFSYKIALLPPALADYVVVHELCHLGAFDHSKRFWGLVAEALPDYKERRAELRRVSFSFS